MSAMKELLTNKDIELKVLETSKKTDEEKSLNMLRKLKESLESKIKFDAETAEKKLTSEKSKLDK